MSHLTSPVNECNTIPVNSMAMTRLQGLGVITSAILPENNPKKLPEYCLLENQKEENSN